MNTATEKNLETSDTSPGQSGKTFTFEIVQFDGGLLDVIRAQGAPWVAVNQLCERLGVDGNAQRKRVLRSSWAQGWTSVMEVQVPGSSQTRPVFCIRRERLAMLLATMNAARIGNKKVRAEVEKYQDKAADALDTWWAKQLAPTPQAALDALPSAPSLGVHESIMTEFLNELRAGREERQASREERQATLNVLLQLTQLTQKLSQAAPPVALPAPEPPAEAPPPPAPKPPKPARKANPAQGVLPETAPPKETYLIRRQIASHCGISPSTFSRFVDSHPDVARLQRADGKWPLAATLEAVKAKRAAIAAAVEAAKPKPPSRNEVRDAIVYCVRSYCIAKRMIGEQIAEVWHQIYTRYAAVMGYDPRELKGKGQRAIDVVAERDHLNQLSEIALEVCPPGVMMQHAVPQHERTQGGTHHA